MFPEDLFAFVLEQFAVDIGGLEATQPPPLQIDSFIARSVMQKAIRRGMTELALRAASALITTDRRTLWRRLLVTALEDLGIGEVDLLARIVAAYRDRAWVMGAGGEWRVISALIRQACEGTRCQAANDLWNVAKNDLTLDAFKGSLCEAELPDLLGIMTDEGEPMDRRGVAVLIALGEDVGPAAPCHIKADPGAIFAAFAGAGRYSHVVAIYEAAFRQSRLALAPLSLCLWSESREIELAGNDDDLPPVTWLGEVPSFALDQYTRPGLAAIRRYSYSSRSWRDFAERWQIARGDWPKAAGELLFRVEGAVVTNRRTWGAGDRMYQRSASLGCLMPEAAVSEGKTLIVRELPHIDKFRGLSLPTTPPAQRAP
jgi:hypothetical protein